MKTMTPKERLYARLAGQTVDKIPNLNIVMGLAAKERGVTYREYACDYRLLADGNELCCELYGIDVFCAISDPSREASAMGAELIWRDDAPPVAGHSPISEGYTKGKLSFPDPSDATRTLDRIRGVEELARRAKGRFPVIGWVEGVLAETADLRGAAQLMEDLIDEPDGMRDTMDAIYEFQKHFALRQIEAGAEFIGIGNAIASVAGPDFYERFGFEYDKRLARAIREAGARVKLHICGNITPLLPILKKVEPDILDIDWMVDFAEAVDFFKDTKIAINGNMDPVRIMMQGTQEEVEADVLRCVVSADAKTLISAGCEVPAQTPADNLTKMNELLYMEKYGNQT